MATTAKIESIIMELPPIARREVYDFVEFLSVKYRKKAEAAQEDRNWKQMSAASLDKIWNNSEDDIYNGVSSGGAVLISDYLVSVRKECFFPLTATIFSLACAAYLCTPPRNPSISFTGEKPPAFHSGNQQFHIRSFRVETI